MTGTGPHRHGIHANHIIVDGQVRAAADVNPRGRTLFDACRDRGRTAVAVLGDHNLVAVMGARAADRHWPPDGRLSPGTPLDELGYATDDAVLTPLCKAVEQGPDLLVAHLNGPDTAGHVYGPDSAEAADAYRATDRALAQVLNALAPCWDDWTVIVVSDHDQETITVDEPVDLAGAARGAGVPVTVVPEGGAALLAGPDPTGGGWLDAVAGVAGHERVGQDTRLVWTSPGRYVGSAASRLKGVHGGPGQTAQVAVVGGGRSAARQLAAQVRHQRPAAASWASAVTRLLDRDAGRPTG